MNNRRRMLMTAQGGAEPEVYINGYVGRGLIHYWDGIDNRGIGEAHASNGLPWVDLAGDMDLPTTWRAETASWFQNEAPFSSKGYIFSRGYRNAFLLPAGNIMTPEWSEFTLEARVPNDSNGAAISFVYSNANGPLISLVFKPTAIGIAYNTNAPYRKLEYIESERPSVDSTLAVVYKLGEITIYVNGSQTATAVAPPSAAVFSSRIAESETKIKASIGTDASSAANGNVFGTNQEVYRVSIYDKALTPQEIATNYENDETRFM